MSATTSARNVGAVGPADAGPAQTVFAVCVALVSVSVPAPVIGEPPTVNSAGAASATLVTVPEPGTDADTAQTPPTNWMTSPLDAPAVLICERASDPVIVEKLGALCGADQPSETTLPLTDCAVRI